MFRVVPFSVSQLAELARVSSDTVRYYARLGLLPETGRNQSGHRYYDELAVERVRFIKGAQWLELRLDQIGELLRLSDSGMCPCGQAEAILRQRIQAVDEQMTRLAAVRAGLCQLLGSPAGLDRPGSADPGPPAGGWAEPATVRLAAGPEVLSHAGCDCCSDAGPRTADEEREELRARMRAVERRLHRLQGAEVGPRSTPRGPAPATDATPQRRLRPSRNEAQDTRREHKKDTR